MTEITLNLTLKELQQIDKYVEVNDDTLSVLMKIKDAYPPQKSPVEEAYKEWMGEYPSTDESVDNTDDIRWRAFQIGWMKSQNNSEDISRVLIEGDDAYIMGVKYQRVEEPYCPDEPEYYDEIEWDIKEGTAPPEPTPSVFRQKLFDGIKSVFYDPEYERTHWKMKVNMAVDEVLTHFYGIIPNKREIVDDFEKGWNSCLTSIKMCMEHTDD
jgi:hypothetical protein